LRQSNPLETTEDEEAAAARAARKLSAFLEHVDSEDPHKTAFITEERTAEFRDLDLPLDDEPSGCDPVEEVLSAEEALLQEKLLGIGCGTDDALAGPSTGLEPSAEREDLEPRAELQVPAKRRPRSTNVIGPPMGVAEILVRSLALTMALSLPLLVVGALHSFGSPRDTDAGGLAARLGTIAQDGVNALAAQAAAWLEGDTQPETTSEALEAAPAAPPVARTPEDGAGLAAPHVIPPEIEPGIRADVEAEIQAAVEAEIPVSLDGEDGDAPGTDFDAAPAHEAARESAPAPVATPPTGPDKSHETPNSSTLDKAAVGR